MARVAKTAVTIDIAVPISSISAKPLTPAVASEKRTSAVIAVTTFASMIVEALAVAGRDRRAHGLAGARLFLDAFEDDDVRVGRDADREDHPGEARQRQRDVEEQDRAVEERGVDAEADHGDEAEEAVEDEQEDRDERGGRRSPPATPRAASPRRASPRSASPGASRTRPAARRSGARSRGPSPRSGPAMPVICAPFEPEMPFGFSLKSIVGHERISLSRTIAKCWNWSWPPKLLSAVAALRELARDLGELVAALVRELHEHDRLPGLRVEVLARAREPQVARRSSRGSGSRRLRLVLEEVVVRDARHGAERRAGSSRRVSARHVITIRFFGTPRTRAFSPSSFVGLASRGLLRRERAGDARFVVRSKTRHSLPPPSWIVDWTGASRS